MSSDLLYAVIDHEDGLYLTNEEKEHVDTISDLTPLLFTNLSSILIHNRVFDDCQEKIGSTIMANLFRQNENPETIYKGLIAYIFIRLPDNDTLLEFQAFVFNIFLNNLYDITDKIYNIDGETFEKIDINPDYIKMNCKYEDNVAKIYFKFRKFCIPRWIFNIVKKKLYAELSETFEYVEFDYE